MAFRLFVNPGWKIGVSACKIGKKIDCRVIIIFLITPQEHVVTNAKLPCIQVVTWKDRCMFGDMEN